MQRKLQVKPLEATEFAAFGDVMEAQVHPTVMIDQGNCARYTDLAELDVHEGRAGSSPFQTKPRSMPASRHMMERHPDGSLAFIPMSNEPFLVVAALDTAGTAYDIKASMTNGEQGVNYHRNTGSKWPTRFMPNA